MSTYTIDKSFMLKQVKVSSLCCLLILFVFLASDLVDLVEIIHVLVRLMEHLQARGTLRVCFLIFE